MEARQDSPDFTGGSNVAIKTPSPLYQETVDFYRETLGLPVIEAGSQSTIFRFGPLRLWIDCCEGLSVPETWLEVRTPDPAAAARHLEGRGVRRCDDVEALPEGFPGFWISSPAGQVHLVCASEDR